MAFEQVELAAVPFLSFVANKRPERRAWPIIRSFCAAMSGTGLVMSGLNTIAIKLKDILASVPAATGKSGGAHASRQLVARCT